MDTRPVLSRLLGGAAALALGAGLLPALTAPALAGPIVPETLRIDEVYGGGGNSGATLTHDFVELSNPTDQAIELEGWSIQYGSARSGTFSGANMLALEGTVPAGESFLIQLAQGTGGTEALPVADQAGDLALSGSGGVVALVEGTDALTCSGQDCSEDAQVADLLGWGGAVTYAGTAPAPGTSGATSVARDEVTGDNAVDFTAGTPTPRNAAGEEGGGEPEPEPVPEPGEVIDIAAIQGTGDTSPVAGQTVTTEGVVTAVYATGGLGGYVIQTGGTGGALEFSSHEGSTALFVYSPDTAEQVEIGQTVQVTGEVQEYYGSTQISVVDGALTAPGAEQEPVEPTTLPAFPTVEEERESIEHMLLLPAQGQLTVTDVYETNRYGEIGVAIGDEPYRQPGEVMEPSAEATALYEQQLAEMILLDDGKTTNFTTSPSEPMSYLSPEEPVRVGAGLDFTEPVVLGYSFDTWRLQPTTPWEDPATDGIDVEDTRTAEPAAVGGDLQVGTFNVLNYFTTLGEDTAGCTAYTDRVGDGTSVSGGCDPRGAWDAEDFERQQSKIVEAISTSGMDVIGLMEIENSARLGEEPDEATASLVDALNARDGEGTWAYVPTADAYAAQGVDGGQDVITNAIIFKPSVAVPTGDAQILVDDPAFDNAREPIGQVFTPVGEQDGATVRGEPFFLVVNHFKSKGSTDAADAELEDDPVQGNARSSRLAQAEALTTWVAERQQELGVEDVMLGGDFNAYTQETAMQVFYDAGYTDVLSARDPEGWSYSYDGMVGSLDHMVVSSGADERITGATDWSINGPESPLALYSRHNTNATELVEDGPFASSDHNPLIVGMDAELGADPIDPGGASFSDVPEGSLFHDEILWAAEQGYVTGWDDGTYRPLEPVHRDAMAAFLYRMAGEPVVELPETSPFTDVAEGDEHYAAIVWAQQEGITTGWADGTFRPTEPIARDAMAAFVYRYAGEPRYADPVMPPFTDVPADSQYATEIAWLQSRGITTGWPDRSYRPLSTMNRDAMAAFMYRMDADGITFQD